MSADDGHEALLKEAWRQADQLVCDGYIDLMSGKRVTPGDKGSATYIRTVLDLIHFKPPQKKLANLPEDFRPQITDSSERA